MLGNEAIGLDFRQEQNHDSDDAIHQPEQQDIARKLDISIKTVEAHRARLIKKLAVKSLAELVQFGVEHRQYHDPN